TTDGLVNTLPASLCFCNLEVTTTIIRIVVTAEIPAIKLWVFSITTAIQQCGRFEMGRAQILPTTMQRGLFCLFGLLLGRHKPNVPIVREVMKNPHYLGGYGGHTLTNDLPDHPSCAFHHMIRRHDDSRQFGIIRNDPVVLLEMFPE
ncbi:MAG: hypothetical protein ACKVK0_16390, partial [Pirellulales bacterium]